MKKELSIHIPEPCHEDWHRMTPLDKGRFCQSCAKQVVDFSLMTDQQILNYMSTATSRVCGRFAGDQLQRPLQPAKQEKKKIWWMAALPLMVLVDKAAAQKEADKATNQVVISVNEMISGMVEMVTDENGDIIENSRPIRTITVKKQKGNPEFEISGQVIDNKSRGIGIPFASVGIKGSKLVTATDADGNFILHGKTDKGPVTLTVNYVGFEDTEVRIILKDTEAVKQDKNYNMQGLLADADNGQAIRFATIATKGTKTITTTDDAGNFKINFKSKNSKETLVASFVGYNETEVPVSLNDSSGTINIGTIKCKPADLNLCDIVVVGGYASYCRKPKIIDTIPALIRSVFHAEQFKVFPNPAQRGQSVTIDTKATGEFSIQLFDNNGKLMQVKEFDATEGATQTPFAIQSSLAPGTYYIRLVDYKTKKQVTNKIVVM